MRFALPILSLLVVLVSASTARANCAACASYEVDVDGFTVSVCTWDTSRDDPAGGALLREDQDSGEVVTVAQVCGEAGTADGVACSPGCFVDRCVQPGRYRYGRVSPFTCSQSCCGGANTPYYAEVTVAPQDAGECTPAGADKANQPYSGDVPWHASSGDSPASNKGSNNVCDDSPLGCSAGGNTRGNQVVWSVNVLLGLVGLLAWRRRGRP